MVVYAAIVGTGDRAQFNASIVNLEGFDQLGAMRGQSVLKVDAGQRRNPHCRALHGSSPASFGAAAHGGEELGQGQIPLVRRAREPLRGRTADPLTAAHIYPVAAGFTASGVQSIQLDHGLSP
jgi:hypothetical protein